LGTTKIKGKYRKVVFTDEQMLLARGSDVFQGKTHRDFIDWLFRRQHKCTVTNHEFLVKRHILQGKACVIIVEGKIGQGLEFI
jgi:hypothetical protein